MANKNITELTELTSVADGDYFHVIDDPTGTPVDKYITYSNLTTGLATGATNPRLELPIAASIPPDSGIAAAALDLFESSAGSPKPKWFVLRCDASTDEGRVWCATIPRDYSSSPVMKIAYHMDGANTSDAAVVVCQVACISDTDTSIEAKAFSTANSSTVTVPDDADTLDVVSITLTNADSMAANDAGIFLIYRDADNASDTAAGDMIWDRVWMEYSA